MIIYSQQTLFMFGDCVLVCCSALCLQSNNTVGSTSTLTLPSQTADAAMGQKFLTLLNLEGLAASVGKASIRAGRGRAQPGRMSLNDLL